MGQFTVLRKQVVDPGQADACYEVVVAAQDSTWRLRATGEAAAKARVLVSEAGSLRLAFVDVPGWQEVESEPCPTCDEYRALCGVCRKVGARHFIVVGDRTVHLCDGCVAPYEVANAVAELPEGSIGVDPQGMAVDLPEARYAEVAAYSETDGCSCCGWF